jgi:hypothetical protein
MKMLPLVKIIDGGKVMVISILVMVKIPKMVKNTIFGFYSMLHIHFFTLNNIETFLKRY